MDRTEAIKKVWCLLNQDKIKEAEDVAIKYNIKLFVGEYFVLLDEGMYYYFKTIKGKEKNMKGLTKQELETLMEAENIIFSYLDGKVKEIFNDSGIALHKAITKYVKLMFEESKYDNDKAVETYVKSDIIAFNNLYNEKVGE